MPEIKDVSVENYAIVCRLIQMYFMNLTFYIDRCVRQNALLMEEKVNASMLLDLQLHLLLNVFIFSIDSASRVRF